MNPSKFAETIAALDAAGGRVAAAAAALGVTPKVLAFRVYRYRAQGKLPPLVRPPREPRTPPRVPAVTPPPALVYDAAARVAGGCPERNDVEIVQAWDGYDDPLDRAASAVAAAGRILGRA